MDNTIALKVKDALIRAGTTFSPSMVHAYDRAVAREANQNCRWVMEKILENESVSRQVLSPLCDDTGVPHLFIELGKNRCLDGRMLEAIKDGVAQGLRELPGRPMAVVGDDIQRLSQECGLSDDSGAVELTPVIIKPVDEDVIRVHIILQGGGPEIRAKTYRVFHKHNADTIKAEIVDWAKEGASQLGCTPCTIAVGIGRSHFEATALMLEAMIYGDYDTQNDFETAITNSINESKVGALGLGGDVTALATFIKIGPQRASGVRIVCVRPCCCFEPRTAFAEL